MTVKSSHGESEKNSFQAHYSIQSLSLFLFLLFFPLAQNRAFHSQHSAWSLCMYVYAPKLWVSLWNMIFSLWISVKCSKCLDHQIDQYKCQNWLATRHFNYKLMKLSRRRYLNAILLTWTLTTNFPILLLLFLLENYMIHWNMQRTMNRS